MTELFDDRHIKIPLVDRKNGGIAISGKMLMQLVSVISLVAATLATVNVKLDALASEHESVSEIHTRQIELMTDLVTANKQVVERMGVQNVELHDLNDSVNEHRMASGQ